MRGDLYVPKPRKKGELYPDYPIVRSQCRARVQGTWHYHQCPHPGKFEEDGMLWCGHHVPSRVAAKEEKREAKYQTDRRRDNAMWAAKGARTKIAKVAIDLFDQKASYDDLEKAVIDWREKHDLDTKLQGEK